MAVLVLGVVLTDGAPASAAVASSLYRPAVGAVASIEPEGEITDGDGGGSSGGGDVAEEGTSNDDSSIVENPLDVGAQTERGDSDAEDRKLWAVVGGLLFVALALTVLTVRYWRQTRPTGPRPARGRRGRRSDDRPAGGRRARSAEERSLLDALEADDIFVDGD